MLNGTVGEKVLVYADDVALYQRVRPVAVHDVGLLLRAECEEVVLLNEVCEITPVPWIYLTHVPLEVVSAVLQLPLQAGFIADCPHPGGGGLYAEAVGG